MILMNLVRENYSKLNNNDLRIYSYIIQNKSEANELNINQMADELGLSTSSIMTFTKKLGLDGYSELKYLIKWSEEDKNSSFDDNEIEYTKNDLLLTMTMMISLNLSDLFKDLEKAEHIYAIASGYTQKNAADELKRNFLTVDKMVYVIDKESPDVIIEKIHKNDVIFAFSLSGENNEMINFLKNLKTKPVLASITKLSNNSLAQMSTYNIPFVTHEVFEYESRTNISPISQFYVVIDFIILKYLSYKENKDSK